MGKTTKQSAKPLEIAVVEVEVKTTKKMYVCPVCGDKYNSEEGAKYCARKDRTPKINPILYQKEVLEVALDYAPRILPCFDCGHPVIDGHCCTFCNSVNPRGVD